MDEATEQRLLADQKAYYGARAPEYDDWWFSRGRYDAGEESNARWAADRLELERELELFAPRGDILELAAGTGLWTRHLIRHADRLTAVDASPETLALNRARVEGDVEYVLADIFAWEPPRRFDVCFFGFWLSHVPSSRFAEFWELVRRALKPDGRVFFVDSADRSPNAPSVQLDDERSRRTVADGREFEIVKRWYEPEELERELAARGWRITVGRTANGLFLVGSGD